MALKAVRQAWSTAKKLLALAVLWALVFSLASIAKLTVAFAYDDGLVCSAPAFAKARASLKPPYPQKEYWSVINQAYDIEETKVLAQGLAWALRALGFRVAIVAERPSTDGEALRKEWRRLTPKAWFHFAGDQDDRRAFLGKGNIVLYFTDSDAAILDARKAGVCAVRLKRGEKSPKRDEDYHPGTLNELVLPLSQY